MDINYKNVTLHDDETMTNALVDHYTELLGDGSFNDNEQTVKPLLERMPRLTEDVRNNLEQLITLQEVLESIKYLFNEKSPGSDGLTSAFFKRYSQLASQSLLEVFNFAVKSEFFARTFCERIRYLLRKVKIKNHFSRLPVIEKFYCAVQIKMYLPSL